MKTAAMNSTVVYLESRASPMASPTPSHQRGSPVVISRAIAARAAAQKKISGVSGVMMIAPTPTIKVAFSRAAAISPAWRCGNIRSPASQISSEPMAAAIGPKNRMPSGLVPRHQVPARMNSATIGGWSKYPACRCCDQRS
jgi:hypothetical protein